jgi:hypothetical protein
LPFPCFSLLSVVVAQRAEVLREWIADAIAAPGAQLRLAERHPELPQTPQLVNQLVARRLAARKRPRDLSMCQAEIAYNQYLWREWDSCISSNEQP